MELITKVLFLRDKSIAFSVRCQKSGRFSLQLSQSGTILGLKDIICRKYVASGTVIVTKKLAGKLRKKLKRVGALKMRAGFRPLGAKLYTHVNVTLRMTPGGVKARTASNGQWASGYINCGRPGLHAGPGVGTVTPSVTANGYRGNAIWGVFYNDTPQDNWVWWRSYLKRYGHEWLAGPQHGPVYVPPDGAYGVSGPEHLLNAPEGQDAYWGGVVEVQWHHGLNDWNWLGANTPDFGYLATYGTWCHVP